MSCDSWKTDFFSEIQESIPSFKSDFFSEVQESIPSLKSDFFSDSDSISVQENSVHSPVQNLLPNISPCDSLLTLSSMEYIPENGILSEIHDNFVQENPVQNVSPSSSKNNSFESWSSFEYNPDYDYNLNVGTQQPTQYDPSTISQEQLNILLNTQ